jgi:hypothetical protein
MMPDLRIAVPAWVAVTLVASYWNVAAHRAEGWAKELPAVAGPAKLTDVSVRPFRCGIRCERIWATYAYRVNGGGKIVVWFDHPGDADGNHVLHFDKYPAKGMSAGTAKTPKAVEAKGRQPGAAGIRPDTSRDLFIKGRTA